MTTAPAEQPLTHRQIVTILVGLMSGMFLAALDQTIVATAIPRSSSRESTRSLNGLPALGISALPGSDAKIVWKSESGRGSRRWA